jgi:20S proteasome subunit alpha 6
MQNIDNVLEILLRLVRGDRAQSSYSGSHHPPSQAPAVATLATTLSAPAAELQTPVSLAVLSIFRLAVDTSVKHGGTKEEVETKVSETIRNLPYHLVFKSLDSIFRDWVAKKN